jgi:hypothetical protein
MTTFNKQSELKPSTYIPISGSICIKNPLGYDKKNTFKIFYENNKEEFIFAADSLAE